MIVICDKFITDLQTYVLSRYKVGVLTLNSLNE